jgi:ferritin-like metal-binding protein YciE
MELNTLRDLYQDELKDIYSAETQILKALPKMAEAASSPELTIAFNEHLEQTREHVRRLEMIFNKMGCDPKGKVCKAMKGLVEEGEEMMNQDAAPAVKDAGLISAAQRVEHYEMAAYGTVRTYAKEMGDKEAMKLLQTTLDEEGDTDKKLTKIAEKTVNLEAMSPA